ncbi:MAG TPA: hypothetical protein VFZ65_12165 [Planctomycetota bacterium]|nr:hypothetical protein [Planctomycetota bacterium]
MVPLLIFWFSFALAAALLLGRMLGRASRRAQPPADPAPHAHDVAEPRCGPFADFRAALLALEQRGELVAKVATLRWVGGLEPEQIAARMQINLATVERCLEVAEQPPSPRGARAGAEPTGSRACCTPRDGRVVSPPTA